MILDEYRKRCIKPSDINEHLPILRAYTEDCESVVELGVRSVVSTWAFLAGHPKKMLSMDIVHPDEYKTHDPESNINLALEMAKQEGIDFEFKLGDSTKIGIPECDLLFIDTEHVRDQLSQEFKLHNAKVKKYIILHDTESAKELWGAIGWLLFEGKWKVKAHYQNNNGLTILERII